MPWQEWSLMDQRTRLVALYHAGVPMTDVAEMFDISPKTGYKWVNRAALGESLSDRSRRPAGHPATTASELVEAIVSARHRFPQWSAAKLITWLRKREPDHAWPSRTTAYELLRRRGLSHARPRRPRRPPLRTALRPATCANDLWTTDFKGCFRLGNRAYCHPLTIRDAAMRYVLRCDGLSNETAAAARGCFDRAFREFGLPNRIRTDNGEPFVCANSRTGLTGLNVWWIRLGIELERITPGHPEQNGSHEQFHAELKKATTRPPAHTFVGQQRRFNVFCREYNEERPHDALQGDVPADHYVPSLRALPRRLPAIEYPGHFDVRYVGANGTISWRNAPLFVSEALRSQPVGLEEVADDVWGLWFCSYQIGRVTADHQWV